MTLMTIYCTLQAYTPVFVYYYCAWHCAIVSCKLSLNITMETKSAWLLLNYLFLFCMTLVINSAHYAWASTTDRILAVFWKRTPRESLSLCPQKKYTQISIITPVVSFKTVFEHKYSRRAAVNYWRKWVNEMLVNCLGGLSLSR